MFARTKTNFGWLREQKKSSVYRESGKSVVSMKKAKVEKSKGEGEVKKHARTILQCKCFRQALRVPRLDRHHQVKGGFVMVVKKVRGDFMTRGRLQQPRAHCTQLPSWQSSGRHHLGSDPRGASECRPRRRCSCSSCAYWPEPQQDCVCLGS